MASISTYLEERLLSFLFKGNAIGLVTPGDNLWLAMFTAGVDLESGNLTNEVAGNGYARVATPMSAWSIAPAILIENAAVLDFPVATGAWGTITHGAIVDAVTGGNILLHGALYLARSVQANDQLRFEVGEARFILD